MRRKKTTTFTGSGALDIVLFMPLGLFFLFAVVDTGLRFVEQGAIEDALRAGLHTAPLHARENSLLHLGGEYELFADQDRAQQTAGEVAREIAQRIAAVKRKFSASDPGAFGVHVAAVLFCVDRSNGSLCPGAAYRVIGEADEGTASVDDAVSERTLYLEREAASEADAAPSSFAMPLGLVYRPERTGDTPELRYQGYALALYAAVKSRSEGLNPSYSRAVLGDKDTVAGQELFLVRKQYG